MNRPSLKGTSKEVLEYIDELEALVEGLRDNGPVQLMRSLNRKMMTLAKDVDAMELDLTADDKALDRFIKMATISRAWTVDFKAFTQEYGPQIKEESTAGQPLIERIINKRSEKSS